MILFLDDIQWGDRASFDLLQALMQDSQSKIYIEGGKSNVTANTTFGLVVVATYRTDDVGDDQIC